MYKEHIQEKQRKKHHHHKNDGGVFQLYIYFITAVSIMVMDKRHNLPNFH